MKTDTKEMNMKEINMNELEQVVGGGACHRAAKRKGLKKLVDWIFSWFE